MSSWTDTFTHDYFTDGTYTFMSGAVEGSTFTVGGGQLHADALGVAWEDQRSSFLVCTMTLDILDVAKLGVGVLGVINAAGDNGVLVELLGPLEGNFGLAACVTSAGTLINSGSFSLGSGPIAITMTVTTTTVTLTVGADPPVAVSIDAPSQAALAGLTLHPFVQLESTSGSLGADDVIATRWSYDTGGGSPPLIVAGVRAGQQASGFVHH